MKIKDRKKDESESFIKTIVTMVTMPRVKVVSEAMQGSFRRYRIVAEKEHTKDVSHLEGVKYIRVIKKEFPRRL